MWGALNEKTPLRGDTKFFEHRTLHYMAGICIFVYQPTSNPPIILGCEAAVENLQPPYREAANYNVKNAKKNIENQPKCEASNLKSLFSKSKCKKLNLGHFLITSIS
jgi:hypothetical protein